MVNAAELVAKAFEYLAFFGPVLILFFIFAFSEKFIDLIIGVFRRR